MGAAMLSGWITKIIRTWLVICGGRLESVSSTKQLSFPELVGVPLSRPEALREKPGQGKLPEVDHT
jgi:hypothetical protein